MQPSADAPQKLSPLVKLALEVGPLAAFFISYNIARGETLTSGLYTAAAVFLVAILIANAVNYALTRTLSRMTLANTVIVALTVGLTFYFDDATFFKMKPTIVQLSIAGILFIGLLRGESYLKLVLEEMTPLEEPGWRKLTRNFAIFFLFMAALNETIWRTQSEATWVFAKAWVYIPLTFLFVFSQAPIMSRYEKKEPAEDG